jgi:hypothetical protein
MLFNYRQKKPYKSLAPFCSLKISIFRNIFFILIILYSFLLLTGCASSTRGYGPNFSPIDWNTKKIAIIKPDLYAFEVSGGGIPEFRLDWTKEAENHLSRAMIVQLEKFRYECVNISEFDSIEKFDLSNSFVKNVSTAISSSLYGENAFLPQIASFNYSIESQNDICDRYGADAVMFIFGADEHYSELRKEVLQRSAVAKTARSMFWSVLSMIFLGGATFKTYSVIPEQTFLCCLVADRTGKIIWFKRYLEADGLNLSNTPDAQKAAEQIVAGLNRRKKQ